MKKNSRTPLFTMLLMVSLSSFAQQLPAIVIDTLRSKDGKVLIARFNNRTGIFTFHLNGQKIVLKQDRTASGVRAHNNKYTYQNWQGNTILRKGNDIVFEIKR
jgi:membrane-bound inhibitor of C-type lysozyme